ncbi:MAG: CHAT domain-containing protein [Bacteroidales bacterium]
MGHIKYISGEFEASLKLLNESLQISKEVDNPWGIADSYLSLGNTYNGMGEYETAVSYYLKCDSIYELIGNDFSRAIPANNIGSVYYWQNDYNNALKQFFIALKYIDLPGIEGDFLALVKSNIGVSYFELNEFEQAEEWLDKAMIIAQRGNIQPRMARIQVSRAKLYIRLQKYDLALTALMEADSILKATQEKELISGLSFFYGKLFYDQKEFAKASLKLQESIDLSKAIGSNKYLWNSLYYYALAQRELGNINVSIEYLIEAVKVLENISTKVAGGEEARKMFEKDENRLDVFQKVVEFLIEEERVDEALDYLNRANNENLKTKFGGINVEFADENKNDALKKEKDLKTKLDKVADEITKEKAKPDNQQSTALIEKLQEIQTVTEKEYISFINTTVQSYPDLMNYFSSSVNPKEFRAAKRNIPEDVATLLYLIGDGKLYIFVATRDSVDARVLDINNQDLENTIRDFYALLTRPSFKVSDTTELRGAKTLMISEDTPDNEATFRSLSNSLYDLLLGPVIDEIKEKRKLVIIPNGVLYYLPFQVLGFKGENDQLRYLVEDFEILYTNKLRFGFQYVEMEQFKIVALGNADNSLPFAETEVNEIKNIFPDAKVYVRDEATVDKVINIPEDYNILHLATHGVLDYNSFENSYLLLASNPENNDDGKLRIEDIYQIQNLDLYNIVTLSACETAVSFEMLEGWPVTTASAFLDLGVGTVIASLWSVDDEATNMLMKSFYENLQTMNKLTALSKAQLTLMHNPKYNHPFYWAPFQFIGDWR